MREKHYSPKRTIGPTHQYVYRILLLGFKKETNRLLPLLNSFLEDHHLKGEIWVTSSVAELDHYLSRYINVIICDCEGLLSLEITPIIQQIRELYSQKLILVTSDSSISATQWGRRWLVDETCVAQTLPETLSRLLTTRINYGRTALVMAGGGILGGYSEMGSLKALYDYGIDCFDMYIGLSAGAFVVSCAANNITPAQMIYENNFNFYDYYNLNTDEFLDRLFRFFPRLYREFHALIKAKPRDVLFFLSSLFSATAFFSGQRMSHKLGTFLDTYGISNDFRVLREQGRDLFIVAMDLDSTERRIFGETVDCIVPISEAVEASSALPVAYSPKKIGDRYYIDGGIQKTANIDVAIEKGADLIICVNPLVPYSGGIPGHISRLGLLGIIEQSYRTLLQRRLLAGLAYYNLRYPDVSILLIEPDTSDISTFHNPLNASKEMIDYSIISGYRWTFQKINNRYDYFSRAFAEHGLQLRKKKVDYQIDSIASQMNESKIARELLIS